MNKTTKVILGLIALFLVVWGVSSGAKNNKSSTTNIAAIIPLTGPAAFFGSEFKNGFDLANKEYHLNVNVEDSKSSPADGVSALQKIITTSNPDIVISILSSVGAAITPPATEKKIIVFQSLTSANNIAAQSPYTFRYFTSGAQEAPIMSRLASGKLGVKTASLIYQNDEYGLAYADAFKKDFESVGGKIVSMDGFARSESDFRGILLKLKSSKPDMIYVIALDQSLATILKQTRESGITSKIATNWVLANPQVISLAGSAADGVYVTSPSYYDENSSPEVKLFNESYKKEYNKVPSAYAAIGYDLVHLLSLVRKDNKDVDRTKLINDLTNIGQVRGIMGDLKIDGEGEITFALRPAVIYAGKLKFLNDK